MNVVSRGVKNALRSPLRSGAITIMLAISIGLIISMLVAHASVTTQIHKVKATTATGITINPAGIMGGFGSGDPLTADQVKTITSTAHVASVTSTLTDQLGTSDTSLTASQELGAFGRRQARFDSSSSSSTSTDSSGTSDTAQPAPTPRIRVTGTTTPTTTETGSLTLTSGSQIDGSSSNLEALVGSSLATKNNLSVGSTFTAYSKTITVRGIYKTDNAFEDSGIIMPLATLQTLSGQAGAVSNVTATVDSSDNVSSTVTALKSALSDKADITSEAERAATSTAQLQSIAGLSLAAVIGASIAGAAIILLAMIMIVRERRREIGVIKAIGGTDGKVMVQFIAEALTLTIIGSIIGFVFGVLVSGPMTSSLVSSQAASTSQTTGGPGAGGPRGFGRVSQQLTQVTASATPAVFLGGIGIVLLIAIIGSTVPAWLIARVRPAEVLRTDG
jgi:putative ABC transport system permease protein